MEYRWVYSYSISINLTMNYTGNAEYSSIWENVCMQGLQIDIPLVLDIHKDDSTYH